MTKIPLLPAIPLVSDNDFVVIEDISSGLTTRCTVAELRAKILSGVSAFRPFSAERSEASTPEELVILSTETRVPYNVSTAFVIDSGDMPPPANGKPLTFYVRGTGSLTVPGIRESDGSFADRTFEAADGPLDLVGNGTNWELA